mmetsp:Transcript_104955/g.334143  ORF Transcript_104955/g.334143 Transcript_104955/m.334143 type:complete len:228 (-) Transcript_104955:93-776(-)
MAVSFMLAMAKMRVNSMESWDGLARGATHSMASDILASNSDSPVSMWTARDLMPKFIISPPMALRFVRRSCTSMIAGSTQKKRPRKPTAASSVPAPAPELSTALSAPVMKPRTAPLTRPSMMLPRNRNATRQLIFQRASLMRSSASSLSRASKASFLLVWRRPCWEASGDKAEASGAMTWWGQRSGGFSRRMPEVAEPADAAVPLLANGESAADWMSTPGDGTSCGL